MKLISHNDLKRSQQFTVKMNTTIVLFAGVSIVLLLLPNAEGKLTFIFIFSLIFDTSAL